MPESSIESRAELLQGILTITGELNSTHDLDYLLNKILTEARRLVHAEAGSIFRTDGQRLKFCYVQNDKFPQQEEGAEAAYIGSEMAVDESSLAGYVAKTGRLLIIDDVYHIDPSEPYSFNRSFDQSSGYRTKSVLTIPMMNSRGRIVGVLQLINALDKQNRVVPFKREDLDYVIFYANSAAMALERAALTRELILRTIRMAELRDPKETGAHVNRVAGYAAEIYARWAHNRGLDQAEIRKNKDIIRVAAMLHDVGKVAISDNILKKPGRLTSQEYLAIKYHTVYGAQLFVSPVSELDQVAQAIALNHHERFDGQGYPGRIEDIMAEEVELGPGKKGDEIPIAARVTALADVYDALISPRVYKDPWPEEKVLETIRGEAGAQFDPEVVTAFFDIYERINLIRARYSE